MTVWRGGFGRGGGVDSLWKANGFQSHNVYYVVKRLISLENAARWYRRAIIILPSLRRGSALCCDVGGPSDATVGIRN